MDAVLDVTLCNLCNEPLPESNVAVGLCTCPACGAIQPGQRSHFVNDTDNARRTLARIAPGGVLRGKYEIVGRLGDGAHGVTYLAEHRFLGHSCVVKLVPAAPGASEAAAARLRHEARLGYRVNHPRVVRVLECDVLRGTWYFVMEYVDGIDLSLPVSRAQRIPWQQVVRIGQDSAEGLAAIHDAGLVHRDIKPGNLLLGTDGRVHVSDLGVAQLARDRRDARATGLATDPAGTLTYAAPEIFLPGSTPDARVDLYALGATLYHLLTGAPPHATDQMFRRIIDVQTRPASWPPDADPSIPNWLIEIVLRLLSIEPDERPADARAVARLLTAGPAPVPAAARATEALQPRGVGVLPLRTAESGPDDEWLGHAIANHLWRGLTDTPDAYVAGYEALTTALRRLDLSEASASPDELLQAGRLVGAGTLVTGTCRLHDRRLAIELTRIAGQPAQTSPIVHLEGPVDELPRMQAALLDHTRSTLGLAARRPPPRAPVALAPTPEAQQRFVLGRLAFLRGDYEEAITLGEEALRHDPQYAEAIGFLGVSLARLGRYAEAEARHREQESLGTARGDARLAIEALANLGVMNYFRGNHAAAEQQLRQAAQLTAQHGLATERAQILNNLGFVLVRLERPSEAEDVFREAIRIHESYGGLASLIGPHNGLGNILIEQGRYGEARDHYRQALALAAEIGDRTSVGMTHGHLGRCAALEERFAEARHEFTMAISTLEETRFWNGLARAYEHMADLNRRLGNDEEAVRCADMRIELARQHSNARMEAAAWRQKAAILRHVGRVEEAGACSARAQAIEDHCAAAP